MKLFSIKRSQWKGRVTLDSGFLQPENMKNSYTCFDRNSRNCTSVESSANPLLREAKVELAIPSTSKANIRCKGLWIRSLKIRFPMAGTTELFLMNLFLRVTFLKWIYRGEKEISQQLQHQT